MPNPRTIKSLTAFKFSDNEILARVAEVLDDDTMAFKVDIVGGLSLTVGDIDIGAVHILNASDVEINPATEETLAAILASLSGGGGAGATEATLSAFKTSFDTRDIGTHAEQVLQTTRLISLDGKDFATQATLLALKTAFDSRDLATNTTLLALKTSFDSRDLATHAEQALQTTRLVSLDSKDFATQATLATLLTTTAFQTRINTLGQKTMAASTPVVIASDQAAIPVSAASLPLPTGASTEATLALIKAKTDNLDVALSTRTKPSDTQPVSAASLPLPTGASTEATLLAQSAKLPATLGQKVMAASMAVVFASDQGALPVSGPLTDAQLRASSLPLPVGAATEATLAAVLAAILAQVCFAPYNISGPTTYVVAADYPVRYILTIKNDGFITNNGFLVEDQN